MKFLNDNILDLLLLIGILFLSVGFFMLSLEIGFIATGITIIICCCVMWWINREGGD